MKHYTINGKTTDRLPDPCRGYSPMTDERFVALGGIITDDGEPTPKETVIASFDSLVHELAGHVQGISIAEFKAAASTMHSGGLVDYARKKNVSEEMIAFARIRVMEIMADALREGVTWAELIGGIRTN